MSIFKLKFISFQVGSKWITNKWVFYNDQFLSYPCGLYSKEKGRRLDVLAKWRGENRVPMPKVG